MKVVIKDREIQIDEEFDYLLDFCSIWFNAGGYAVTTCTHANLFILEDFGCEFKQNILFHRLIYQVHNKRKLETDVHIDHINGDKLDNRIPNLRVLTPSQNNKNKKLRDSQIYHNIYYHMNNNYFIFSHQEAGIVRKFRELRHALEYFTRYDNDNDNVLTKSINDRKPIEEVENVVLEPDGFCENCESVLWSQQNLMRHQKKCRGNQS